jgi:hypothetical protein
LWRAEFITQDGWKRGILPDGPGKIRRRLRAIQRAAQGILRFSAASWRERDLLVAAQFEKPISVRREQRMSGHRSTITPQSPDRVAELIASQTSQTDWLHLIRAEYLEIPGLRLTRDQARRLWSLDSTTCDALLQALIDVRFLRRTSAGSYVRADVY